jgi:hypothetical protein
LLGLLALVAPALAQERPAAEPAKSAGYVVSDKLLEAVAKRWAFELADNIDLDENEETQIREALSRRWVPFFKQHQQELAPLVERWMQAMVIPLRRAPRTCSPGPAMLWRCRIRSSRSSTARKKSLPSCCRPRRSAD